jgi:glycerol-3-phosphate acyltransferase PlsY
MRFKGGKGIATTIGVFMVCSPLVTAISGVLAIVFILITEMGAMGSFIAITPPAIAVAIRLFMTYGETTNSVTSIIHVFSNLIILSICFFTWLAHRKNIERMLSGDEHPTSIKSMVIKAKAKKIKNKEQNNEK